MASDINSFTGRMRIRKNFGKIQEGIDIPNLIEVQKSSYDAFLGIGDGKNKQVFGIANIFKQVFPIQDMSGQMQLEFAAYELEKPKYDVEECLQRDMTYAAPLRVKLRLIISDIEEKTGVRMIRDIRENEVYMGDIPLMTDNGTFVVNGAERVIVSQMHRSPGVFFDHDKGKAVTGGKLLYSARVIPYRGSWLDFEFDAKDILYVRIDRKKKIPVTTLLMVLESAETERLRAEFAKKEKPLSPTDYRIQGMSKEEILGSFYKKKSYQRFKENWKTDFVPESFSSFSLAIDLVDAKTGKVMAEKDKKISKKQLQKLAEAGMKEMLIPNDAIWGEYLAEDIINEKNGLVIAEAGDALDEELIGNILALGIKTLVVLDIDNQTVGPHLRNTLMADKNRVREEALTDIYRVIRPGEPPTLESAENLLTSLFFDSERYDLSAVGRVKMNSRLGIDDVDDTCRVLRKKDIVAIVGMLLKIRDGHGDVDDIDHLGNRRVRSVGELLENQYRIGLLRMERAMRERMSSVDIDVVTPQDMINSKPVVAAVRDFFTGSQLSQFMDQTNPLSEITHKRRLSALGPGGLTRERAGFEVRDVHPTHYGRICPIETPEGPNIGLINSLATYARVNEYGFIETPYRRVENGVVSNEITYMSATEETQYTIGQANAQIGKKQDLLDDIIPVRAQGEYLVAQPKEIDYLDVSPKQVVSVAAALIPFLENDDANRALMGSNMQRQAVPLLRAEAPLVGTGIEARVARDSGVAVVARRQGIIDFVDSTRIVIRVTEDIVSSESNVDIYNLLKFQRSNQNTCINQRPLVKAGDIVKVGDIIADGPSTDLGELALGRNVLVAFLPWNGYNFEDSILISERIVRDDVFTSIHIEEHEVVARDTKLGEEEITRDIPNVGEEALKNLDESGIVYIGAEVKAGDILIGKVTPKGETPITPEEKLLRAIFGEKASDMRDSSLRVPPGVVGTVVNVRVFSRRGIDKDERSLAIEQAEIKKLAQDRNDERVILERSFSLRLRDMLDGQTVSKATYEVNSGLKLNAENLAELNSAQMRHIIVKNAKINNELEALIKLFEQQIGTLNAHFDDRVDKVRAGDDLQPGVMKMVKVFVAVKRRLQPGDKMAGRHGNKGVISRIMPIEDMPYLEDGTPVDMALNPLGVPSRMNVGQILETHLGWAAHGFGTQVKDVLQSIHEQRGTITDLRKKFDSIYDSEPEQELLNEMDEESLMSLGANLTRGVPMATPVFDGVKEEKLNQLLAQANMPESGQVRLIDGRTGEYFDRMVTVGYIYMLKLHHLVDDKIHARSIGPYSLVTQQPLGGKAQFGGQRFGEMEVWALEAYGAGYTLQEMLTVKSDDISGRTKVYEAIVRGDNNFEAGIPESFNVLIKELHSLCLNIELVSEN